ncbi:hydroxyacylglutathione hydrolase [Methylophaga thiooxydans]|uniref:Hydroxyacylglutathione hydrolase n=1 Tax=Methylophaga thiooxydans DMS010 TaxID=637616 RepID=C0N5S2_9GAMM|nr:hydroxyacylglutathione hydrolase [Methylophaga thiooxydans]EEF80014.1 metallo-beta-lactamase superfamily protein [Methylophaga thiooxydans DMS010]
MLHVHPVPAFQDNYIWLIQAKNSQKILIVDPGDAIPVIEAINQHNLQPVAILITHHHADHIGGIPALLEQFNVPVYGPAAENIPMISHPLNALDELHIDPDFPCFQVLDTPGHTAGHICYLAANKLFCGDTLFAGGCGRLLGGTATDLFDSLQRLSNLPADTEIYCAHEYTEANLRFAKAVEKNNRDLDSRIKQTRQQREDNQATVPSLLAEELATNPFLRSHNPNVKRAAEHYAGHPLDNAEAVFTTLRQWKDQF